MNIQMRNQKLLKQPPGELEHAGIYRCNKDLTLDDISNTLKEVRKCKNVGKYLFYEGNNFREKNPFRVGNKETHGDKAKKKVYAIGQVQGEEIQAEGSDSNSMGDPIRQNSDDDWDPI
ncbi:hypothetical protein O181_025699 [Austropuccinia psidii MF-1]|uniref:Uncharacterized protein n=1 Tax=Austropuccinia psidii MF-1 TaxID=1389203 RepID=A0A9Q3CIJ7_9BASI|nr:hypothetical protein [Austropuccinia psidii MF-1]